MKGIILDFSIQQSTGLISAEDGNRYEFAAAEWQEHDFPHRGTEVDFTINADGKAIAVYRTNTFNAFNSFPHAHTAPNIHFQDLLPKPKPNLIDNFLFVVGKNYVNFKGRASRYEFWMFQLAYFLLQLIILALQIVGFILESDIIITFTLMLSWISITALFLPSLAINTRRLHDVGKSGWFQLIALIPLIGAIFLIVLYCSSSQKHTNLYGEPPTV